MSINHPKVSIVIPNYNYGLYIAETLTSVLMQTFQDFEVIVVDDGSTDISSKIIEEFVPKFNGRLRPFFQKNLGPSVARNKGIQNARGNYIAFLDADDIWVLSTLEKNVAYLEKNLSMGMVYANTEFFDSKSGKSLGLDHQPGGKIPYEGNCIDKLFVNGNFITMMTTLIRKKVFEEVGFFDDRFKVGEDFDLWMRIASKFPIGYINEVLCRVRRHGNNLSLNSREIAKRQIWGTRKILNIFPELKSHVGENVIKQKYYTGYILLAIDAILHGKQKTGRRWLKKALKIDSNILKNNIGVYYCLSFFPLSKFIKGIRQSWHRLRYLVRPK